MKRKLILLMVLTGLFIGYIGVQFVVLSKQNEYGRLQIASSPNTNVFLDNINVGRTPYDQKVKIGDHAVKLIPDREATATATWQGKVKVFKNALSYVNRELGNSDITSAGEIFTIIPADVEQRMAGTGQVYVETEPVGAIVYLDTDEKGVAPLVLSEILKGTHELSIYMPGFFRRTQKINVEEYRKVNASIKLAIDQEAQKKAASDSAKLNPKNASDSAKLSPTPTGAKPSKKTAKILQTPTGFLRVRTEPNVNASESARVSPGDTFTVIEEQPNWLKIPYADGKEGWISSQYVKVEE
jgi:hypothetical protein